MCSRTNGTCMAPTGPWDGHDVSLVQTDQKPIGWMEREAWENLHQLLRTSGFLKEDVDIDQAVSIDLLPGVGQ